MSERALVLSMCNTTNSTTIILKSFLNLKFEENASTLYKTTKNDTTYYEKMISKC